MPTVVESMMCSDSRDRITLIPLRVSVLLPGRPVLTFSVRSTLPFCVTVIRCVCVLTVLTIADPMLNVLCEPDDVQRSFLVSIPAMSASTVTFVPGFQYLAGRKISWRESSQPHWPVTAGEAVTLTRRSTSARLAVSTGLTNWITTGIPTPTTPDDGITV